MESTVWTSDPSAAPALRQVARVLEDDELCSILRDAVRLGRTGTLEEYDVTTPRFQRGQAAYLKVCNQLRRALARTEWAEEHPENQQCFVLPALGDDLPLRITYFAGRFESDGKYFKVNPKGKVTKLSLARNREQFTFLDEDGFWDENSASLKDDPEIALFLMSAWDLEMQDDGWRVRIRTWLALCDTPLNRKGKPQEEADDARFTRATVLAYRLLDDYLYGGPAEVPRGPEPVRVSPVVIDLTDVSDEMGR